MRGGLRPGSGRPKGALAPATVALAIAKHNIKEMALKHAPMALKTLVDIAQKEGAPEAARIAASNSLLDRAFGKAAQVIEGNDDAPIRQVLEIVWASSNVLNANES